MCWCARVRVTSSVCARGMGGYSGDRTGLVRSFRRVAGTLAQAWRGAPAPPPPLPQPLPCMHSSCTGGEASRRLPSAAQCGPGRPPSSTFTFWSDCPTSAVLHSLSFSLPLYYLNPLPLYPTLRPHPHPHVHAHSHSLSLSLAPSFFHTQPLFSSHIPIRTYPSISLGALQQSAAAEGRSSVNCPRWTR